MGRIDHLPQDHAVQELGSGIIIACDIKSTKTILDLLKLDDLLGGVPKIFRQEKGSEHTVHEDSLGQGLNIIQLKKNQTLRISNGISMRSY